MPHTYKTSVLANAIFNLIQDNLVTLGIDGVLYGDHTNVPSGLMAVVMPGRKRRELAGVAGPGGRSMNFMSVIIFVYDSRLQDEATARNAVDGISEGIEDLLHQDTTMGGIVIHGFVTEMDPGLVPKDGSMFRAVQMIYEARTKTNIDTS